MYSSQNMGKVHGWRTAIPSQWRDLDEMLACFHRGCCGSVLGSFALVYVHVSCKLIRTSEGLTASRFSARVWTCARMRAQLPMQSQRSSHFELEWTHVLGQIRGLREGSAKDRHFSLRKVQHGSDTHRSQYVHLNGLLPLCVRLCIVNAPAIANALPQPG